mgnify:CR=1 FL=1
MRKNNLRHFQLISIGICLLAGTTLSAQNDLLAELEDETKDETQYTFATFKGTRVVNLQSPEIPGKGVLQYSILHRFGSFDNEFFYNFLGLDNAQIKMGLDYSPTNWLNVGWGHSSFQKVYDGYVKYRLVRQSTGAKTFPFTITGFSALYYKSQKFTDNLPHDDTERLSYVHELVIARKFGKKFSAEIVPAFTHFNVVETKDNNNDIIAIGGALRYKLSHMIAVTAEYIYQVNPNDYTHFNGNVETYANAFSVGCDLETGGHVFQLFLTNSRGVTEPYTIAETPGRWLDNDIHFGFNISRVFTLQKPKVPKEG